MSSPAWFSQQSLAEYLSCSVRQVQKLTHEGKLPVSYALGARSPRYSRELIDRYLNQQKATEPADGPRLAAG